MTPTDGSREEAAPCRAVLDRDFTVGDIDPRMCGSFVEHLGRVVYSGIYEPGHPEADAAGFRGDVLELVRALGVTLVRYPGGNFVSAYDWRDGIGPRERRPRRLDPAWRTIETNAFGLDEFLAWSKSAGVEPFLVFNLGTEGVRSACDMVEYLNADTSSALADLRRANGHAAPYGVRLFGLGNEMDGAWQIGSRSAAEYGALASQVATAVKRIDAGVELVAAGSSKRTMRTFPEWDRVVLEHVYDDVEYFALHQYYPANAKDVQSFAASSADFEELVAAGVATCDYVGELKRSRRKMSLSIDEWNVNYLDDPAEVRVPWQEAPAFAEFDYTRLDAVVAGSLLIPLIRHADRVRVACQSLLVNVGAPILARRGGAAEKLAIYAPIAEVFARLAGATALGLSLRSPELSTDAYGEVPQLDAAAVTRPEDGHVSLICVNRSLVRPAELEVEARGWGRPSRARAQAITGCREEHDSAFEPLEVILGEGHTVRCTLPAGSFAVLDLELEAQ
ncbi:MAG TPA: alpha-L-arabinofuranosidase C-terminal domain-containing protein [Acidimicrobiales bacterium]|nr:alpha-L-arabinofuranosidase C-terminal domain-containing protein [Acidimicrobiales bacterium]